jgi:hypothetical protein
VSEEKGEGCFEALECCGVVGCGTRELEGDDGGAVVFQICSIELLRSVST